MKVYLYCRQSGIYQGECFQPAAEPLEEGVTTTAPPPWPRGSVPVFSPESGEWSVRKVNGFHDEQ